MSMKKAAEAVGIKAPTMSEHIKRLEEDLDIELFRRKTRQIELTNEGRLLFSYAEEMFRSGFRFLDAVSPNLVGGYPARVGILETISVSTPTQFVFNYLERFKEFGSVNTIRELHHDLLEDRILKNDLDWGISVHRPKLTALDYKLIGQSEVMFCASDKVLKKYKDKKEILETLPLVKSSWDEKLNYMVEEHLRMHGINVSEYFESDHRFYCITLVQKSLCVSTFSKEEIRVSSWAKNLRAFFIGSPLYLPFYAIWPKGGRKKIAIKKLLDTLASV